jgi:light-regulated signal transduction histidine kinase (bacteriophytochrome)
VLKNIEQVFEPELSETQGQIIYGQLPLIKGIATQIEQLFQNLISNALKYHGSLPPKIYITYKEDEQYWTFFVKDNGIGINAKFFEKIFVIFQRLHSNSKYSGTGIGLAVCKKIVDRHKGSIWVESEPNIGSIFYFTVYKNL